MLVVIIVADTGEWAPATMSDIGRGEPEDGAHARKIDGTTSNGTHESLSMLESFD